MPEGLNGLRFGSVRGNTYRYIDPLVVRGLTTLAEPDSQFQRWSRSLASYLLNVLVWMISIIPPSSFSRYDLL